MKKIVDYTDETRDTTIVEQKALGFELIEDQRHLDGNHLVFVVPERDLVAEIDQIKIDLEILKAKVK